ncbi:hypothetical protein CfE428DRAFT_0958 [Chthoniobacter flavus Ellin428]|uniref:Prepilin-type N-terminal cleavage/methylation domain-containing protein n=1 Tax=Chthoniobacter flavus Ellin428 TaxID=497964 RepID=B4CWC1_9BACT|nr:prepilin-type N-terminal cleavage/methylation domain-containing protein [Chthoniobacter flavus]EDY21713.1 hypothetical protein CfE428DRAFT_0958 [Chthoniobacter flavus Ellin428]TCO95648.1 uncharacterized protein (TIGR02598 family) [Chthoniobacter flavus]
MKSLRSSLTRGFTLVEVVLALGIATIGLVSILGLLNAATDADGDAGRDTTVVAMSDYVLNELHTVPFDALWFRDPTQNWSAAPSMTTQIDDTLYYFTNEGSPIPASSVASNPDFVYKCVVRKIPDSTSQNLLTGYYNLMKVQLDFYWPATVGDEALNNNPVGNKQSSKIAKKTLHVTIARH